MPSPAPLGVVIVAYNSADVILDCLETLCAAAAIDRTALRIVVVDNASPDDSVQAVADWVSGKKPWMAPGDLPFTAPALSKPLAPHLVTVIPARVNGGFAAGVNIGLHHLFADPDIGRVWVLNPDTLIPPGTPAAFAAYDPGPFALMGGRATYTDPPDMIQIDGGTLNHRTGVTGNINLGRSFAATPAPQASEMDFITGASMVASRAFWDRAGPMVEDYFLYYEEVDWALRRGDLPLALCPAARVFHRTGTVIGSATLGRPASPFSLYFLHRGRLRFVRRHLPRARVTAWAYTLAKAAQYWLKGWRAEARPRPDGARDGPLPETVRARLGPVAAAHAGAQSNPASTRALSAASAVRKRP